MKELLEYIVKNLVNNPDSVVVEEDNQDGNVNLYLTVHPDDMGIIIGKGGQTIHAIRKVLTVRAISENVRINLQLNEPEGSDKSQESRVKEEESEPIDNTSEGPARSADESPVETQEEPEVKSEVDTSEVNREKGKPEEK